MFSVTLMSTVHMYAQGAMSGWSVCRQHWTFVQKGHVFIFKQTNKQTNKHTNKQTNKQTNIFDNTGYMIYGLNMIVLDPKFDIANTRCLQSYGAQA